MSREYPEGIADLDFRLAVGAVLGMVRWLFGIFDVLYSRFFSLFLSIAVFYYAPALYPLLFTSSDRSSQKSDRGNAG